MTLTHFGRLVSTAVLSSLTLAAIGCVSGGSSSIGLPPSVLGTHTVIGRAFYPGGIMVLVDAHLRDGISSGTVEFSQVQSRGEITLRVFSEVDCVGLFKNGTQAVVAGPITRVDGDYEGLIGSRDWWMVQIEEGGSDGDLLFSSRIPRDRGLSFCQEGPAQAATLRAVDGDLSIH